MPFSRKKEGCCKETGCEPLAGIRAPLEREGTRDAAGRSGLGKTTPEGKDPTAAGIPCPCLLQFGAAAPRSPWLCRSPQLSSSSLRPVQPWVPQLRALSSKSLPVRGEQDESLPTPHLVSANSRSTSPSASTGFKPTAPTPGQQHPEDTQPWLLRRQAAAIPWEDKPIPSPRECCRSTNSPCISACPKLGPKPSGVTSARSLGGLTGDSLSPCLAVLAAPSLPFSLALSRCAGAPSRAGELCSPPLALPELSPWLCPCCPHFCSSPGPCWLQTLRESNTGVTSSRTHHLLLLSLVPPLLGHPFRCTLARPSLLLPAEAGFHRELITLCSCPTDSQCPKCPKLPPTKKGAGSASSREPGSFGSKGETGQGRVTLEGSRSPHPASGAGAPSGCFPAAPAGQGGAWPGRTLQEGHKEVLCSAP